MPVCSLRRLDEAAGAPRRVVPCRLPPRGMASGLLLLLPCLLCLLVAWPLPHAAVSVANPFCPDDYFASSLATRDRHGALTAYEPPPPPRTGSAVFPCHNFAYTGPAEQWDGPPVNLSRLQRPCYFSVGACEAHGVRSAHQAADVPPPSAPPVSIFVPTTVRYVQGQFSAAQVGQCRTPCRYVYPEAVDQVNWVDVAVQHDAVLFPLDWSYGSASAALPEAGSVGHQAKLRHGRTWIGFSEEDLFDPSSGRPDLWADPAVRGRLDWTATYDYDSADIPFNLYRFHFWRECSVNMYYRNVSAVDFRRVAAGPPAIVSYVSRNCRPERDALVQRLMRYVGVACLGKCLHNTAWPFPKASYPYWQEKLIAIQRYKFTLALQGFDGGALISEKLYDAFAAGTVPVFFGVSRRVVERFAPAPHSFVHVDDYPSLEDLGRALVAYGANDDAYNALHAWRRAPPSQQFCRLLSTNINSLACRVCDKVARGQGHDAPATHGGSMPPVEPPERPETTVFFVVRSSASRAARRATIRRAWGDHVHATVVFLVTRDGPKDARRGGVSPLLSAVEAEAAAAQDVWVAPSMREGHLHTGMNDTLWAMEEALARSDFAYYFVAHDDVFVNVATLTGNLRAMPRVFSLYVGVVRGNEVVNRSTVAKEEYPLVMYPGYAEEKHYMLSRDNVEFIVRNGRYLRPLLGVLDEGVTLATWLVARQVHPEHHAMFSAWPDQGTALSVSGLAVDDEFYAAAAAATAARRAQELDEVG